MSDWQARFEKLKNAIRIYSWRACADGMRWQYYNNEPGYRESAARHAATALGQELLKAGLIEIQEWDADGKDNGGPLGSHITQFRVEVLAPIDGKHHFTDQIDDAFRDGYQRAIADIFAQAAICKRMDMYGPVQALAMEGLAKQMQERVSTIKPAVEPE